jgi:hypothetical protein
MGKCGVGEVNRFDLVMKVMGVIGELSEYE